MFNHAKDSGKIIIEQRIDPLEPQPLVPESQDELKKKYFAQFLIGGEDQI